MILTNPRERSRFLKFAVVGTIGAVIDFGLFNLLVSFTIIPPLGAQAISFTAAVSSNFLWNRFWTYPDSRSKPVVRQLQQFFLINIVGLAIRTPLFGWLERLLVDLSTSNHISYGILTPTVIGHNISLACAVGVVLLWNFFANRFWTYNDVS
jgi:putative flippase GtrA